MNIPYKFENTSEALEELCKLISNFIKKTGINTEKIMNICINISGRVIRIPDTASVCLISLNGH